MLDDMGESPRRIKVINFVFILTIFNFVAANAMRILLTLYALKLGASATVVGILGGLLFLFPLLLSWVVGALVDRKGAVGLLSLGASLACLSLLLIYFSPSIQMFYFAAALNGLALSFFHVTLQALVGAHSTSDDRAKNFANFSVVGSLTGFVGPMLAGLLIDHLGFPITCLFTATLSIVVLVLLFCYGGLLPKAQSQIHSKSSKPLDWMDKGVWVMLLTSGMVQLGYDVFQFYLPIKGHNLNLSASAIGSTMAALAGAALLVRLFLAWLVRRMTGLTLLSIVFSIGAMCYGIMPFATSGLSLFLIAVLFGLGMGIGIPLTVIMMYEDSVAGRAGQILGMRLTANNLVRMGGPMIFGALGTALGLAGVFWMMSGIMVGGVLLARAQR
jgi:MFS family permease